MLPYKAAYSSEYKGVPKFFQKFTVLFWYILSLWLGYLIHYRTQAYMTEQYSNNLSFQIPLDCIPDSINHTTLR